MKWLGLDYDGKHHEWDNWLRSALEEYVQGYHNSLDRGSRGAPCIEYVKLEGERIPTPMFDKLCFQKVILLCIGMSMLAGEHAEKALGIYGRHIVGDVRLDEERAANASAAPRQAKAFVLGTEEAARQEGLRYDELVQTIRREVSLELTTLLAQWQQRMDTRDDHLKLAMCNRDAARDEQLHLVLSNRDARWQQELMHRDEQWQAALQLQLQTAATLGAQLVTGLSSLRATMSMLPFNMGQKISDVIGAAVLNPGSALLRNLRAAVKRPAIRSTTSARRFPASQKASQVEVLGMLVSLFSVAISFFPGITYDVWKSVRVGFGKAVKQARMQRNALDEADAAYIARPLLWSFVGDRAAAGGGPRYVVLTEHRSLLVSTWHAVRAVGRGRRRRVESLHQEAQRRQAAVQSQAGYSPEPWPLQSTEIEPDFDSSDED
jgi:hypothetical protein